MSTPLEGIVRPSADAFVGPSPFNKPGQKSNEPVRIMVGNEGTYKTLGTHVSFSLTFQMGQQHIETTPGNSQTLQKAMTASATTQGPQIGSTTVTTSS